MKIELTCFSAAWCGPCRTMKPIIDIIEMEDPDIRINRVDVSDESLMEKYAAERITAIPAFLITVDGVQHSKLIGIQSKNKLVEAIKAAKESF